jgi:hypothetical protein
VIPATRLVQRHRQVNHPLIEVARSWLGFAPGRLPLLMGFEILSGAE